MKRIRVALTVLLLIAACKSEDPVRGTLDAFMKAIEDRDADEAGELIASGYSDPGGGKAEAVALLKRYLAGYETVDIDLSNVEIHRATSSAVVRFRAGFRGRARKIGGLADLLPESASYDFELQMADPGDGWKISGAAWTEARPAAQ